MQPQVKISALRRPSTWVATLCVILVGLALFAELDRISPGPLAAAHASVSELQGNRSCKQCHGASPSLKDACLTCHSALGADIAAARGLHATLGDAQLEHCAVCHSDHQGIEFELISDASFGAAGVADWAAFDHATVGVTLKGKHASAACDACHTSIHADFQAPGERRFGGLTMACVDCHADEHEGLLGNDCAACHSQTRPFDRVKRHEHQGGFDDGGAHGEADCRACHAPAGPWSIELALARSPSETPRSCSSCHADRHSATLLANVAALAGVPREASCVECHDPRDADFRGRAGAMETGRHAVTGFELAGAHGALDCAACHDASAPDDGDYSRRFPGRAQADCAACHAEPHGDDFGELGRTEASCASCHGVESFATSTFDASDHARLGFELIGAHAAQLCSACHVAAPDQGPRRFSGLGSACVDCHTDPHRSDFDDGPFAAQSCDECHALEAFKPNRFSALMHAATAFPLQEAHAAVGCSECHGAPHQGATRTFSLANAECADCHDDVHDGTFDAADLPEVHGGQRGCARCHGTQRFDMASEAAFDHGLWTGFILDGAHARAECDVCHVRSVRASDNLRTFGRAYHGLNDGQDSCATCHEDVHGTPFAAAFVEPTDCSECHTTNGFEALDVAAFDHRRWTGYDTGGGHADLACADCHAPLPRPASNGRTTARAQGTECADCHGDPHLGQFLERGQRSTDCARCHGSDSALTFDHQRDSRFAIDDQHMELPCAECHRTATTAAGLTTVRYKPLGMLCGDCHRTSKR